MKKLFALVTLSILLCSASKAQDITSYPKYAISFGIGNNFTLTHFNMDIAVKKVVDKTHQLRFFISPRISTNNQDEDNSEINDSREDTRNQYSIGLGSDYLWTLMYNDDFNMFGGSGLSFSYGNEYRESTRYGDDSIEYKDELTNPSFSLGIRGILGVEWKVSSKVGIHSEYLLSFSYNRNKQETNSFSNGNNIRTRTVTSSRVMLQSSVLFGISIYF